MSDQHPALSPFAPLPSTEADYDAICAAVMETVRGRWFLAEYAKRNRHADTATIVAAVERIEAGLRESPAVAPSEDVRSGVTEMADAIARTRAELAAIRVGGNGNGALVESVEELTAIVQTTERAASDILAAAERVQETAWAARERGVDSTICDALDRHATQIYTACSFQDLTGQRTDKVIEALRFVEDRIATMIDIWGKGPGTQTPEAPSVHARPPVGFPESLLDQSDVDGMLPAMPVEHPPATSLHADAQGPQSELPQAEPAAEHAGPQAEAVGLLDRILDVVRRSMAEPEEAAPAAAPPPGKARGRLMDFVSPLLPIQWAPADNTAVRDDHANMAAGSRRAEPAPATSAVPIEDPAEDILVPRSEPITVAEAVEQMLVNGPPRALRSRPQGNGAAAPAQELREAAPPFRPTQAEAFATEPAAPLERMRSFVQEGADGPVDSPDPVPVVAAEEPAATASPLALDEPAPAIPAPIPEPFGTVTEASAAAVAAPAAPPPKPKPSAQRSGPLAAIAAMSEQEKIALFS